MNSKIELALKGIVLYGDDFSPSEVEEWFEEERHGYEGLKSDPKRPYEYHYHELNRHHGYRHLPGSAKLRQVLLLGGAGGDEIEPIRERVQDVSVLEPGEQFHAQGASNSMNYSVPHYSGNLCFEDDQFDLINCLGVLHHIPNVSHVVSELYRVLAPGGYLLAREPIVSMGDWRLARGSLTKNERGIPLHLLNEIFNSAGFQVLQATPCVFPPLQRLLKFPIYNSRLLVRVDAVLSRLFQRNYTYHATSAIKKLRPASCYMVLRKP